MNKNRFINWVSTLYYDIIKEKWVIITRCNGNGDKTYIPPDQVLVDDINCPRGEFRAEPFFPVDNVNKSNSTDSPLVPINTQPEELLKPPFGVSITR